MNKQYKHIVKWVKSKGIEIIYTDDDYSCFKHSKPDTIYIGKKTKHGLSATILHEYYHTQQFKRCVLTPERNQQIEFRANIEYRAETFVVRCCKKLGITYNKRFIKRNWYDWANGSDEPDYYVKAYKLLIKNKVF